MARTDKEPCGCVSNETSWVSLCPTHLAEREAREQELPLDSLQWLINHYERFPQQENLRHVVIRLAQVGKQAYTRPAILQWVRAHADLVKQAASQAAKPAA